MKPLFSIAITVLAILLISSGSLLVTHSTMASQTLSTTIVGGVTNLGSQIYIVNGGQVAYAEITGLTLDPGATITYNLLATQSGFSTSGSANIALTGTTGGVPISMSGSFKINDNVPGAVINQGELPFFFETSTSNLQLTIAGSTQTIPESLSIESPYFNPFGAPIILASPDGAIVIAATYNQGSILWSGTQLAGQLSGTLGSTLTSGTLTLTTGEIENLVTGTAIDAGTTSFSSADTSSLNANGYYSGTSMIPMSPTADCSASTGIPGTCTETGFQSTGQFTAGGISGTYSSTWAVPALQFSNSINAAVLQSVATKSVSGIVSSSGALCFSNGGIWVSPTCTIPSGAEWNIAPSTTLMIDNGVTLVNNGTLLNDGTILSSGNIVNNGVVTNDGVTFYNGNSSPKGTFTNNGIFTNDAGVTFNNFGTFTNSASGTVNNYGTYQNHTGGATYNYGTFFNYGNTDSHVDTFYVYGSFASMSSGTVSNSGRATLTNECGGQTLNVSNNEYGQVADCSS